jgi:ABC-type anion transport system duplicated permease subunit
MALHLLAIAVVALAISIPLTVWLALRARWKRQLPVEEIERILGACGDAFGHALGRLKRRRPG